MKSLFPILFLLLSGSILSQIKNDSVFPDRGNMKTSIYSAFLVGYNFSGDAKDNSERWKSGQMHTIELLYAKVFKYGGPHGGSKVYYIGNDLSLSNKYDFFVAPKIGINVGAGLIFGTEIQLQTNFEQFVPRIMPYLGLGGWGGKFYIGYNFRMAKAENLPVNTGHIGLTWAIIKGKDKNKN